jgi:hypothetical protein
MRNLTPVGSALRNPDAVGALSDQVVVHPYGDLDRRSGLEASIATACLAFLLDFGLLLAFVSAATVFFAMRTSLRVHSRASVPLGQTAELRQKFSDHG